MLELLNVLCSKLGIDRSLDTPRGVVARYIGENQIMYVNTTSSTFRIDNAVPARSLITGNVYSDYILLEPYEVDMIELSK